MSYSSPEGIILSEGSVLISSSLSINKEKVFEIKEPTKKYTEEEMYLLIGEYQEYLINSDNTPLTISIAEERHKKPKTCY